jgi:hypothetical protein
MHGVLLEWFWILPPLLLARRYLNILRATAGSRDAWRREFFCTWFKDTAIRLRIALGRLPVKLNVEMFRTIDCISLYFSSIMILKHDRLTQFYFTINILCVEKLKKRNKQSRKLQRLVFQHFKFILKTAKIFGEEWIGCAEETEANPLPQGKFILWR